MNTNKHDYPYTYVLTVLNHPLVLVIRWYAIAGDVPSAEWCMRRISIDKGISIDIVRRVFAEDLAHDHREIARRGDLYSEMYEDLSSHHCPAWVIQTQDDYVWSKADWTIKEHVDNTGWDDAYVDDHALYYDVERNEDPI